MINKPKKEKTKKYELDSQYRQPLLELFSARTEPLSVPEILTMFQKDKLTPNKTTIYREISSLLQKGTLIEVVFGDEKKRYELADREHHHHLVCNNCNSVQDIYVEKDVSQIEKQIEKTTNFKVQNHSLEFFGLCQNCK